MYLKRSGLGLGLLFLLTVGPTVADADQVSLKDGTLIIGTISRMAGGVLEISNGAADGGTIKVLFAEVASISSDAPHIIELGDGTRLRGQPMTGPAGQIAVQTQDAGAVPVDPSKVKAINPPPSKSIQHVGSIGLNGRITDGNSRTKSVGSVADYVGKFNRSRLSIRGSWNYEENEGDLSARDATGSMKYDYFFSKRVFGYVNTLFEGDDFADLNLRSTLGAGAGCQFVNADEDGKPYSYYEELGVSLVDEDFDTARDNRYAACRVAGKLEWKLSETVKVFHHHEIYFSFEDQDDLYANTQSGLRATLVGNLFATVQVNYDWDNTPAASTRRSDTEYLFGLGWSFSY